MRHVVGEPPKPIRAIALGILAAFVSAVALWRAFGLESGFPAVPLMAYTPYVLPLAVAVALAAAATRLWGQSALAAAAALFLAIAVLPRALGSEYSGTEGTSVNVMAANVLKGEADPEHLANLAAERDTEVLTVQELTPRFAEAFDRAGARRRFPHRELAAREGVAGSGIYSRYPLRRLSTGEEDFLQMRALAEHPAGLTLDITSAHPRPPISGQAAELWEEVLGRFRAADGDGATQLLLGDFNATLDQDAFRGVLDRGFTDAAEEVGDGLRMTWPALPKPSRYLPVAIDHLLAETEGLVGVRDFEVLHLEDSDHRPVAATLHLRP